MLSIGKLVPGQASYYERQVAEGRDDYYSGRGEAPGEWVGRGAAVLELSGRVDGARFAALMAGVDPTDERLERPLRDSRGEPKVVGFDLTFSAPKSVSVLFAVADDGTAGELVAAHEGAVRAALEYVEEEAVRVRRGKAGAEVLAADGLVAAAYRHRMSRALDPQLHTHVVAANVARGPDGRWTALHGHELYVHAKTAGTLYQAHLRAEIAERLGLEWGPVRNGMAELADVDAGVLEHFSARRTAVKERAVERYAQDLTQAIADAHDVPVGELPAELVRTPESLTVEERATAIALLNTARGQIVATETRERKSYGVETHTWREEIVARAAEHGLDSQAIDELLDRGRRQLDRQQLLQAAPVVYVGADTLAETLVGPAGLTERANTFHPRDVVREYAAAAQQGAHVADVRARGRAFAAREDVLATVGSALTCEDLVGCERRLIAAAAGRAGEGTAPVAPAVLERALAAADRPLSSEQAAAVRGVVESGNGVDVIEALAGTGKTFTAGVLRRVYEDAGYQVIGIAPTGRAVRELSREAGTAAWTLDRALLDLDRYGALPERTVVLFDEAGMAGTRASGRLLAAAERARAKVVAIGDSGQLASVQAGGWMREVGRQVGAHTLTEVQRQRDGSERRALAHLHDGRSDRFLAWAQRTERLVVNTDGRVIAAALTDWRAAAAAHGPASAVLIVRDNATRDQLNHAARAHERAGGRLGVDVAYGERRFAVGERVICRRNDPAADVDNGTRGTLRATRNDGVTLETDAGAVRELPVAYVAEYLEPAYCLTGHGMQGGTVEHATVVATPRELTRGWSYTALSRARGTSRLHIDAGEGRYAADRAEVAPGERRGVRSVDEVLAQTAARMRIRDDEDLAVAQLTDLPEPQRATQPGAGRAPARTPRPVEDPLAAVRDVLGPYADRLPDLAVNPHLAGASDEQLARAAAARHGAVDRLPVPELYTLRRVAADRDARQAERDELRARIAALEARRADLGFRQRRERDQVDRELDVRRSELTAATARVAELDAIEQAMRDTGRHPEQWLARDALAAVEWAQIDRELRERREHAAEQAAEAAAQPASPRLEATLGDRPAAGQERDAWDALAGELERHRVRYGLDPDRDGPLGPADRPAVAADAHEVARYRDDRERLATALDAWRMPQFERDGAGRDAAGL